jgi:hypothetical protein
MCCASLLKTVTETSATAVPLANTMRRRTMKYICLGYIEPGKFEGMTKDERHATFDECFEYNDHLRANGYLVSDTSSRSAVETNLWLFSGRIARAFFWFWVKVFSSVWGHPWNGITRPEGFLKRKARFRAESRRIAPQARTVASSSPCRPRLR